MQYSQEMSKARELAEEALMLSEEARMYIVDALEQSVCDYAEDENEFELDAEWSAEIKRRMDDVRSGRAVLYDGEQVLEEVRQLLRS